MGPCHVSVTMYLLVIGLFFTSFVNSVTEERFRVDCIPGQEPDQTLCNSRGCSWDPPTVDSLAPPCYFPDDYGYKAYEAPYKTPGGYQVDLYKEDERSLFGGEFRNISIVFEFQTSNRLRVKIHPTDTARYEVPIVIEGTGQAADETEYGLRFYYEPTFSFRIHRISTDSVLFDSRLGGLTISDQFLQISTLLPSENIYGFAEQEQPSFKHDLNWRTWGMFAHDHAPEGDANLYGVHPRYTVLENDGNAHGVLILNSNAQDVTLTPAPGLVYRTIGGVLDLYFFLGPEPEAVVSQYTEAVGRYYVPPYWALGFHLCRWGYNSSANMYAAWKRTRDAGIPFDAQWGDIDIMDRALDFTVNPTEFNNLPAFVDNLHEVGMKFVTILDPCISTGEEPGSYPAFDEGNTLDIWVKNSSGQPLVAKVWPADNCFFPDYSMNKTQDWWVNNINRFYQELEWDGLWIDMNEPANFVTGSVSGCPDNKYNYPPYKPYTEGGDLLQKTICMDAQHSWGSHYDTHSMFGWSETQPTLAGVRQATHKRGLVLSRSTFVGSGRWTAHWLGDNWSQWDNMHYSIIGMLQFNQFGIPLVGADICGFIGDAEEEMCARWHQLGAFYPFSRNHNVLDAADQDPGVWEGGRVARVAKYALIQKYALLPYLYTLFYKHSQSGTTVVRPLWHEFPTDSQTYDIDTQFMWGSALLISPVIEPGKTERDLYLPPEGVWYDFSDVFSGREGGEVSGGVVTVSSDLDAEYPSLPLHMRGGHIIPIQRQDTHDGSYTTAEARELDMNLVVLLDDEEGAEGELYLDDGESIDAEIDNYSLVRFEAGNGAMIGFAEIKTFTDVSFKFSHVSVYGLNEEVTGVMVNNEIHSSFLYDDELKRLIIQDLTLEPLDDFSIHWM